MSGEKIGGSDKTRQPSRRESGRSGKTSSSPDVKHTLAGPNSAIADQKGLKCRVTRANACS
jgi:hypothetical protein